MEKEREKWLKNDYYSSYHQILLVGEGDFSFALSLATTLGSASNMVATSLDSYDSLTRKYKKARSNLDSLEKMGATLLHGVDATKMKLHTHLNMRKFDRILFNFPHAGFHGKEESHRIIRMHRRLVHGFFHNACGMLRPDGEIHINHKTSSPFCHWNLEQLANCNSLLLIKCVPFKIEDYPSYKNKRGDGKRCDEPFPLGECSTFKFIMCKKKSMSQKTKRESLLKPIQMTQDQPSDSDSLGHSNSGQGNKFTAELSWIFRGYFNYVEEMFGMPEERIGYNVHAALSEGCETFINNMASERPLGDFIIFLEELHRLSRMRIEQLKQNLQF